MSNLLRICGHNSQGKTLLFTDADLINNALHQEQNGIKPHYAWYDYKTQKPITPKGWLIISNMEKCIIVYRRSDGKMIKTVGELRKILNDLDDDYKLDIRIMKEIPEKELIGRSYPYPWEMIDGYLEFQDIGYSDKELCIGVYEKIGCYK